MEYTKDIIFNVEYIKKSNFLHNKFKKIKKLKDLIIKDDFFTLTIIISIIFLSIDYLFIRKFIEIMNLL